MNGDANLKSIMNLFGFYGSTNKYTVHFHSNLIFIQIIDSVWLGSINVECTQLFQYTVHTLYTLY